jgi:hypothetical protein
MKCPGSPDTLSEATRRCPTARTATVSVTALPTAAWPRRVRLGPSLRAWCAWCAVPLAMERCFHLKVLTAFPRSAPRVGTSGRLVEWGGAIPQTVPNHSDAEPGSRAGRAESPA